VQLERAREGVDGFVQEPPLRVEALQEEPVGGQLRVQGEPDGFEVGRAGLRLGHVRLDIPADAAEEVRFPRQVDRHLVARGARGAEPITVPFELRLPLCEMVTPAPAVTVGRYSPRAPRASARATR
jgi:hypothetical protein